MARRRKEPEAGDQWLDRLVDEMYQRMERGERPSLTHLLEELLHRLMERERQRFLEMSKGEQAHGFYQRKLYLTLGQLDLKVPRVRRGGAFRPAILPPPWRRVEVDYEELLIAMLANGYSYAQMERAAGTLGDAPLSGGPGGCSGPYPGAAGGLHRPSPCLPTGPPSAPPPTGPSCGAREARWRTSPCWWPWA